MRACAVVVLLWGTAVSATPLPLPDEDDPKLARRAPSPAPWWRPAHAVPRLKLSYRRLTAAGLSGGTQPFDVVELDGYPLSRLVRVGLDGEVGWGGGNYGLWYVAAGLTAGVQYPARVTPFLEARFVAGLLGGSLRGQSAVSWIWQGGVETGVEIYVVRRFYLSAAIGWTHVVYGGVDVAALDRGAVVPADFGADSFTVKVGVGL